MTLQQLNESSWIGKVGKTFKEKGTAGAFTQQCKEMGFQKASYNCIQHVVKEFEKIKKQYEVGEVDKKTYDEWTLKKKRATLAKTFKGWAKKSY